MYQLKSKLWSELGYVCIDSREKPRHITHTLAYIISKTLSLVVVLAADSLKLFSDP